MKGIIMAGGSGTRLFPTTKAVNKNLLPVYDKPMIYYSISLLVYAGVKDILLILSPGDLEAFRHLLGDGRRFGIRIHYLAEEKPLGTMWAFLLGREFVGEDTLALTLRDNVFFGAGLTVAVRSAAKRFETDGGAQLFCRWVENPCDFGVVEYDDYGAIRSLESKPQVPKSHYAVTGLFFFNQETMQLARDNDSAVNGSMCFSQFLNRCLSLGKLHSVNLDETVQWFDAGTPQRLFEAAAAVKRYQENTGQFAGCIEEAAFSCTLIGDEQLQSLSANLSGTEYGRHLAALAAKTHTAGVPVC